MNILTRIFKPRTMIRASSKDQKKAWLKSQALHQQLAKECGREWKAVK
jgi:hypothetical protein